MRSVRGWSVLLVLAAACGRTDLESPALVASITPPEQSVKQGATASTVVYTEATNPLVKMHISSMVTGP